ncbi:MAG: aminopeptidase P family N-terminal domain-containing protein, partial [Nocardioidaceae bacterium]
MGEHHASRRARLGDVLAQRELDAAFVTDLVNVRYLTGFTGSNGAVCARSDGTATLVTDGRYRDQSAREAPDVERVIDRDLLGAMAALLEGDAAVGLETHDLSVDAHADLVGRLDERGIASTSVG